MNYCSIEDAWKNNDYITDQYKKYNDQPINDVENIENFDNLSQTFNPKFNYEIGPKKNYHKCVFTCDNFLEHLNTCESCRRKIRNNFSSKIISELKNFISDNKDSILLFHLGFSF